MATDDTEFYFYDLPRRVRAPPYQLTGKFEHQMSRYVRKPLLDQTDLFNNKMNPTIFFLTRDWTSLWWRRNE